MSNATLEHNAEMVLVGTHSPDVCAGQHCTIHNRSNHSMRAFPQHWRNDRGIMERTCPHGIGHPDPDEISSLTRRVGAERANIEAVHGCDGCCQGAYE